MIFYRVRAWTCSIRTKFRSSSMPRRCHGMSELTWRRATTYDDVPVKAVTAMSVAANCASVRRPLDRHDWFSGLATAVVLLSSW